MEFSNLRPSAPPPDYNRLYNPGPSKGHLIKTLIEKYEIDPLFSEKLDILHNYEIVLLVDDSGSMNTPLSDNTKHSTRWDELKEVVNIVISIATIYDDNGVDIHFLNRPPVHNIIHTGDVAHIFNDPPHGATPLTDSLKYILNRFEQSTKSILIVIATDGLPNKSGYCDLKNFKTTLLNKNHSKFFVSFLACSDQESDIGYLNELDRKVPNVDTLDDYISERKEVQKVQGSDFSYTFGDHVVRLLLGPLCPELDELDEKKISKKKNKSCYIL